MERKVGLVLVLFLVVGMLVDQSKAGITWDMKNCYDRCTKNCFNGAFDHRAFLGCVNCSAYCRMKVEGKLCVLFWCWKVRR